MIICGLKLTHDGSVAVIESNKLLFSIEIEKLNNNKRYSGIENTDLILDILKTQGVTSKDIDYFAIDGWGGDDQDALAIQPRLEIGKEYNKISISDGNKEYYLNVARYTEKDLNSNILNELKFHGLTINGESYPYSSFLHVTGHVAGAYCSSPFAQRGEDSYVLIWDGGMYPRLYYVEGRSNKIENLGPIFLLIGNIYTIFSQHFGPFKVKGNFAKDDLSVAGKVMAYIALGNIQTNLFGTFEKIYYDSYNNPMGFANFFANEFKRSINGNYTDEDVLHSFHAFLEKLLIEKIEKKIKRYPRSGKNLCLAGGCALNIKWNSAIRNSGLFKEVYVPPFPNDSGSAIGAACAKMMIETGKANLDWDVYSGCTIIKNGDNKNWTSAACSISELAALLYSLKEPVVFLSEKSELGPRALGNRSIISDATSPAIKNILNIIKQRESYRPVSPICIEEKAKDIFEPGSPDPYMLFDHKVKSGWLEKIPGVCHLDGTARLQTVNQEMNPILYELLSAYYQVSAIPVLCNTSANYKGSGFFPDVLSAMNWDMVNYIWCENTLYERKDKLSFNSFN